MILITGTRKGIGRYLAEYYANKGYVVLSVNYRSGIGYGEEFRNAPGRGGRGNTEYQDILAATFQTAHYI